MNRPTREQCTGVIAPCRECNDTSGKCHGARKVIVEVLCGPSPQLAFIVPSPAFHRPIQLQCAGVEGAGGDLRGAEIRNGSLVGIHRERAGGAPPLQAPPQPPNTEPALAVAVRLSDVPLLTVFEQAPLPAPHTIPGGALETLPAPTPPVCTVSVLQPPSNRGKEGRRRQRRVRRVACSCQLPGSYSATWNLRVSLATVAPWPSSTSTFQ